MEKAKNTSKLLSKLTKTVDKVSTRLTRVESSTSTNNVAASAPTTSSLSTSNATKIESLATDIAKLNLELFQLKDQLDQSNTSSKDEGKIVLNSAEMNNWFKTKFDAHLKTPESRSYIKEMAESKIRSTQVIVS